MGKRRLPVSQGFGTNLFVRPVLLPSILISLGLQLSRAEPLRLSRPDYTDKAHAAWVAQMVAVYLGFPFEHQTAAQTWVKDYPKPYTFSIIDDDWYYEMSALRAFERHGPALTVQQLGAQWLADRCGTWGSSKEARLLLERGVQPPDTGHPRFNRSWWTIGPQFSAEIYGLLAPGRPNLAAKLAREFGHINGHAEGVDAAVFVAGMVSLGFVETDPRVIVRKAAVLVHPESPYRRCIDEIISLADAGKSFEEIVHIVVDRWALEYPGTNNAVANGGIIALSVWFGEGDFLKTVNLAVRAADFLDADCNAAGAAAVVGVMKGLRAIPKNLLDPLHDRIQGDKLGDVQIPAVDETISALGKRTAAMGEKILLIQGIRLDGETLVIPSEAIQTLPSERFQLADLTKWWAPDWKLERAGFGSTSGGMGGYPGGTWLTGETLTTWPRELMRGVVISRRVTVSTNANRLSVEVTTDNAKAWELSIYADNKLLERKSVTGTGVGGRWQTIETDLTAFDGRTVTLRLIQNVLPGTSARSPGAAHWRAPKIVKAQAGQ